MRVRKDVDPLCSAKRVTSSQSTYAHPVFLGHVLTGLSREQPDFGSYIDALRKTVQQKCTSCSAEFCLACGEPISRDKVHRPSAATDDNPLFHCSNLQGVILGVGLSMLEDAYTETNVAAAGASESNSSKSTPAKKKRKLEGTPEEDEEEYYGSGPKGKKAKGGIGYAGAVKEDVSANSAHPAHVTD